MNIYLPNHHSCRSEWGVIQRMIEVVFPFPVSRSSWTKFPPITLRLKRVVNRGSWDNHWGHPRSRPWCGTGWGVELASGRVCWKRSNWNPGLEDKAQKGAPGRGNTGQIPKAFAQGTPRLGWAVSVLAGVLSFLGVGP